MTPETITKVNLIPNFMEFCYGQISIETATYSLPSIALGQVGTMKLIAKIRLSVKRVYIPKVYINSCHVGKFHEFLPI